MLQSGLRPSFLTPLKFCALIFILEWQDLQFKGDSEQQIFEKLFMTIFIYSSEFLPEICRKEVSEEIFSYFRFDV